MNGNYDLDLMFISCCLAMAAAYAAFDLGERIAFFDGRQRRLWLLGGALAVGSGIWAAHLVGIQAAGLPLRLSFDLQLSLLSWLAAVSVGLLALYIISRNQPGAGGVAGGGVAMGLGLCVTHYTGMFALRLTPAISYDSELFSSSVFIAVAVSVAVLLTGILVRQLPASGMSPAKACGALLMGIAICGMQYTVMAAARFSGDAVCAVDNRLGGELMGLPLAGFTLALIAAALLLSMVDAHQLEARLRLEQARMEQRFRGKLLRG